MKNTLLWILLLTSGAANAALGDKLYIKPLQAHVYVEPSDKSKIKITLGKGRKVVELQRKSGFINIHIDKTGGMQGWVKAKETSPTDSDGLR